jgi:hypothetical protein
MLDLLKAEPIQAKDRAHRATERRKRGAPIHPTRIRTPDRSRSKSSEQLHISS